MHIEITINRQPNGIDPTFNVIVKNGDRVVKQIETIPFATVANPRYLAIESEGEIFVHVHKPEFKVWWNASDANGSLCAEWSVCGSSDSYDYIGELCDLTDCEAGTAIGLFCGRHCEKMLFDISGLFDGTATKVTAVIPH